MEARLNRTALDKISATSYLVVMSLIFALSYGNLDVYDKIIFIIIVLACLVNVYFIFSTPVLIIKDNVLYLYSEVQPVIINFKPQIVNLSEITKFEISKKLLEYRAIFSMQHGGKVYHGFPATRNKRVEYFMEFLNKNTASEAIEITL